MFWATFTWDRRTDLVTMIRDPAAKRGAITAQAYCVVLDEYLPTVLDANSIFMHNNARLIQLSFQRNRWMMTTLSL
jgi:hypothetical protein